MLNLKRFDRSVWFDYPKGEGVRFKIRPYSKKASLECMARASRLMTKIDEDWKESLTETPSRLLLVWEMFAYCLEDWKGIQFSGSEVISRKDALEALFEDDNIKEFVFEAANRLREDEENALEAELKNSGPSQGG